jgi:hypothetical protein
VPFEGFVNKENCFGRKKPEQKGPKMHQRGPAAVRQVSIGDLQ